MGSICKNNTGAASFRMQSTDFPSTGKTFPTHTYVRPSTRARTHSHTRARTHTHTHAHAPAATHEDFKGKRKFKHLVELWSPLTYGNSPKNGSNLGQRGAKKAESSVWGGGLNFLCMPNKGFQWEPFQQKCVRTVRTTFLSRLLPCALRRRRQRQR